jgi:hypothetical protein
LHTFENLHPQAVGLKLYKLNAADELLGNELVIFQDGRKAVDTILRRAQLSGRVEIDGDIDRHFADVYIDEYTWDQTIALDAGSYRALKRVWARTKYDPDTVQFLANKRKEKS